MSHRSSGILPPQQTITVIEFYNDILCFEHKSHEFYRLGAAAAGYRRYGAETTEEIILKPLNPLSCRISCNKKRTRIARIARMDKLCIREIRVIRVRRKKQLVLCFVGALFAWLVQFLLG